MSFDIQRVYSYTGEQPAILADRLWPRGIRKETLSHVLWLKEVTPSADLRRWFHADPDHRYAEFCTRYLSELAQPALKPALQKIRQLAQLHDKVILLTAAKSPDKSHIPVLISVLSQP